MHVGRIVADRFRIESKLGEGGFGAVYLSTDLRAGGRCALKLLHVDALLRDETRARFRREARLAQALSHPHVVRLLDFGESEEGIPFIAFEHLSGRSLEQALRAEGAMSPARVANIGRQTLEALVHAHDAGIIHRDIKPANLFLTSSAGEADFVKVLDFGIAAVGSELASQTLTREGTTVGTPAYMSPEQVMAEPLDGRADLYSLGLTLAECIAGSPVYRGTTAMRIAIDQASSAGVPLPQEVSASPLGPVIVRSTRKNREERYAGAREMLAGLDGAMPRAVVPLVTPSQRGSSRRLIALSALVLTLGIVALLGAGYVISQNRAEAGRSAPRCDGGAMSSRGCTFHGHDLAELRAIVEEEGYVFKQTPTDQSTMAMFQRGSLTVLVRLDTRPLEPSKKDSGVISTCWGQCYLSIAVWPNDVAESERHRLAIGLLEKMAAP